jgi:hypothetical protein
MGTGLADDRKKSIHNPVLCSQLMSLHRLISDTSNIILKIDLSAMLFLPLVVGQIMTSYGVLLGCLFVIAWNFGAWLVEFQLIDEIFRAIPALAEKQTVKKSGQCCLNLQR